MISPISVLKLSSKMRFTILIVFPFFIATSLYLPQVTGERLPSDESTKLLILYLKELIKPERSCDPHARPMFYITIVKDLGGIYTISECQYEMEKLRLELKSCKEGRPCKLSPIQIKLLKVAKDTSASAYVQVEKRKQIEKVLQEVGVKLDIANADSFCQSEPNVDESQKKSYLNNRMPKHLVTKLLVQYLKQALAKVNKKGQYRKHGPFDTSTFYENVANGVGENYTDDQCKTEMGHLRKYYAHIQAGKSCTALSDIQRKLLESAVKVNPSFHVYDDETRKEIEKVLEEESMLHNESNAEISKRSGSNVDQQENKRPRYERMPSDAATDLVVIYLRAATKPEKLHQLHSKKATHCVNAVAYLGEKYTAQQCQLEMELLKQDFENSQAGRSHALSDLQKKLMELYMKVSAETYVLDRETEQEITETLKKVTAQRIVTLTQGSESNQS